MKRSRGLVLAPHPDDEAIGCGGTLRWHVEQGDEVHVIFLTSGEDGVRGQTPGETARIREREARAAAKVLGYGTLEFWREPDGKLRSTTAIRNRLAEKLRSFRPHLLYVPHPGEMHPDQDRKSTRLNSSHVALSRMPSSA